MQEGSLLELIQRLSSRRGEVALVLGAVPVLSWLVGLALKRISRRAAARFLTVPIHLIVPLGTVMTCVVAYLALFAGENLLSRYDAVLLFGPILSMLVTLVAVSKVLPFDEIPGSDRLVGMIAVAAAAFLLAYLLDRLVLHIFVVTSLPMLMVIFAVLFIALRIGWSKVVR